MDLGKRTERWLKRGLFGLLLGRGRDDGGGSVEVARVRRVLVVRANFRMGNLLLVTPALAALRSALPLARIDVIGARGYVDLLEHSPFVDRCIGIDRRTLMAPWSLLRLVRHLRRQSYDVAIDGGRGSSFLGAFLVAVSGSGKRIAAAGSRYDALFNVHVPIDPAATHKVDMLLSVLAGLGIETPERAPSVTLTAEECDEAARRWRALGVTPEKPAIAVNVGARGAKRWQAERVVELVNALCAAHDRPVVLLAGPEDDEHLREIGPRVPAGVAVAPRMGIRAFAAFLSQAAVLVTQDTGPMHLAAAVGVPTVALLVAPRSMTFAPRGERDRAVFAGRRPRLPAVLEAVRAALERPQGGGRSGAVAQRPSS